MRYDPETTRCPGCGTSFTPTGRQRWCSNACRQAGWRNRQPAPNPIPADAADRRVPTVYQRPDCHQRLTDSQRCHDCNTFCHKLGPGGPCPHCDEPLTLEELLNSWA